MCSCDKALIVFVYGVGEYLPEHPPSIIYFESPPPCFCVKYILFVV